MALEKNGLPYKIKGEDIEFKIENFPNGQCFKYSSGLMIIRMTVALNFESTTDELFDYLQPFISRPTVNITFANGSNVEYRNFIKNVTVLTTTSNCTVIKEATTGIFVQNPLIVAIGLWK